MLSRLEKLLGWDPCCRECGERKADATDKLGGRCELCVLTSITGVIGAVLIARVMGPHLDLAPMIESAVQDLALMAGLGARPDMARALYLAQHVDLNVKEDQLE